MQEYVTELRSYLNSKVNGNRVSLLDVGCGAFSYISFKNCEITGIDISMDQLIKNNKIHNRIHGDIQFYNFYQEQFNIVVCWDVLEHLPDPLLALHNMFTSLKPGGYCVIKMPNVLSVKGLVTKFTPYSFHKFFNRKIRKSKKDPFKTFMRFVIRESFVTEFAKDYSLKLVCKDRFDVSKMLRKHIFIWVVYELMYYFFWLISLGYLSKSDVVLVYKK